MCRSRSYFGDAFSLSVHFLHYFVIHIKSIKAFQLFWLAACLENILQFVEMIANE